MVEQMKGQIKLESSVAGKGSVFSFTIPIAKPTDKPSNPNNPTQIPVTS
jgi:sensor histidine kinase regulating citrate/malate metabolism